MKNTEFVVESVVRIDSPTRRRIADRVRYVTLRDTFENLTAAHDEAARVQAEYLRKTGGMETLVRVEVTKVVTTEVWKWEDNRRG